MFYPYVEISQEKTTEAERLVSSNIKNICRVAKYSW